MTDPDLIPQMTADDAPSPYVISSDITTPYAAVYTLFDNNASPRAVTVAWGDNSHLGYNHYVRVDLGSGVQKYLTGYSITACSDGGNRVPLGWIIQGSNDASSWADLDTKTSQSAYSNSEKRTYAITATSKYRYFQYYFTANGSSGDEINLDQMEFLGRASLRDKSQVIWVE